MKTPEQVSAKLRFEAFESPLSKQIECSHDGQLRSFGLIHEFWQKNVLVTMAAFKTGDLSLYFSSGGAILGGIQNVKVAELVRKTIPLLAQLTSRLERRDEFESPAPGEVTFTILTTQGRFRSRLTAMPTRDPSDPNFQLFALSQGLIAEMRKASDSKTA